MNAAALFSTAQSLFGGSKLAGSYNIASNPGHASGSGSGTADGEIIGLWTVQRATHKTNGKTVSIWTLDKNALGTQGTTGGSRYKGKIKLDPTLEVLKKEVGACSVLSFCTACLDTPSVHSIDINTVASTPSMRSGSSRGAGRN